MSCRSTPANYAATTEARMCARTLDDAQVQSLFHTLKREARASSMDTPSLADYRDWLDKAETRVRSERRLLPGVQERIIANLYEARHADIPDAATWHALGNIRAAADVSVSRLASIFAAAGSALNMSPHAVGEKFNDWRAAPESAFEDYPAPEERYRLDLTSGVPTDDRTSRALRKLGYEMYLAEPLPVFVYGTLRTGGHNAVLMDGARAGIAPARADGIAIYGGSHGFPYATSHDDPNAFTVGEIVWLTNNAAGRTSRMYLDHLEGFHSDHPSDSHYLRTRRTVQVTDADGSVSEHVAWVYLAEGWAKARLQEHDRIHHGDWFVATGRLSASAS